MVLNAEPNDRRSAVAILLAAGDSRRFGPEDKRLAQLSGSSRSTRSLGSDRTMLQATLASLVLAGVETVVVLKQIDQGHLGDLLGEAFSLSSSSPSSSSSSQNRVECCFVSPHDYSEHEQGMGRSLAEAVDWVNKRSRFNGRDLLIMLGDMPYIAPSTIQQVVSAGRTLQSSQSIHASHASVPRVSDKDAPPLQAKSIVVPTLCDGRRGHPVLFGPAWRDALMQVKGDQGGREILQQQANAVYTMPCDDPMIVVDIDTPTALDALQDNERYSTVCPI